MWPFLKISVLRSMSPASILINFWIDKPESKESVQESVQGIKRIRCSKESKGIEPKHPTWRSPKVALLWDLDIDYRSLPFVTLHSSPSKGPPLKVRPVGDHAWVENGWQVVWCKIQKSCRLNFELHFRGTAARRKRTTRTGRDDADGCNWVRCDVRTRNKQKKREKLQMLK